MLILRTLHGSRLYGLAHADSDWDWYEVHDHARTRQRIDGTQDVLRISLSEWLQQCDKGVPQALEAMFAPEDAVSVDLFARMRQGYRVHTAHTVATYRRTITAFEKSGSENGSEKLLRHARRLSHDLGQLLEYGRFDPTAFARRESVF